MSSARPDASARRSPPACASGASRCARTAPSSCSSASRTRRSQTWRGSLEPGPWVAHTSGATPLAALDPHERRFGLHPLQTFTKRRGPEQLDGAYAAVSAESVGAQDVGFWLARTLGLEAFALLDESRPLYHAGAAIASNYLVTLHRVASELFLAAGAPPEGLVPLMRRTIDNDFELTGPIERGDWETVERHRAAIRAARPELEPLYDVLAEATAR